MIYLDVDHISSNDATVVQVSAQFVTKDGVETLVAKGTSKRDPIDKNDEDLGLELALGRALSSLGRRLERRSNGKIRHNDNIRVIQSLQRSKIQETQDVQKGKKEAKKDK